MSRRATSYRLLLAAAVTATTMKQGGNCRLHQEWRWRLRQRNNSNQTTKRLIVMSWCVSVCVCAERLAATKEQPRQSFHQGGASCCLVDDETIMAPATSTEDNEKKEIKVKHGETVERTITRKMSTVVDEHQATIARRNLPVTACRQQENSQMWLMTMMTVKQQVEGNNNTKRKNKWISRCWSRFYRSQQ